MGVRFYHLILVLLTNIALPSSFHCRLGQESGERFSSYTRISEHRLLRVKRSICDLTPIHVTRIASNSNDGLKGTKEDPSNTLHQDLIKRSTIILNFHWASL